jgi:indole-3-glycerol phosphate synthase
MADILADICATKREHIAHQKKERSEAALLRAAESVDAPRGFMRALQAKKEFALIAEIKKASPSRGIIREDFEPRALAEAYENGGAACLSVLTDAPYFQGDDAYIAQVKSVCALPVLRKDFMLEPYQIIESRALGADCVLLIMAALGNSQVEELFAAAQAMGLDALIEVHNEAELDRALERLNPPMIGVNNRDLKTLEISLEVSKRLAPRMPADVLKVAESGIYANSELQELRKSGFNTFLVGESLMREKDVAAATKKLLCG